MTEAVVKAALRAALAVEDGMLVLIVAAACVKPAAVRTADALPMPAPTVAARAALLPAAATRALATAAEKPPAAPPFCAAAVTINEVIVAASTLPNFAARLAVSTGDWLSVAISEASLAVTTEPRRPPSSRRAAMQPRRNSSRFRAPRRSRGSNVCALSSGPAS